MGLLFLHTVPLYHPSAWLTTSRRAIQLPCGLPLPIICTSVQLCRPAALCHLQWWHCWPLHKDNPHSQLSLSPPLPLSLTMLSTAPSPQVSITDNSALSRAQRGGAGPSAWWIDYTIDITAPNQPRVAQLIQQLIISLAVWLFFIPNLERDWVNLFLR